MMKQPWWTWLVELLTGWDLCFLTENEVRFKRNDK